MNCRVKPKDHLIDMLVERGISSDELKNMVKKGAVKKTIKIGKNIDKCHKEHGIWKMVIIKQPCRINLETMYPR